MIIGIGILMSFIMGFLGRYVAKEKNRSRQEKEKEKSPLKKISL
jgi:hypothetical protein